MEEICNNIFDRYLREEGSIISILLDVEEAYGYLPEDVLNWFSKRLKIPIAEFYGIATFYNQFHLKRRGKHIITCCCGTACHVKGSKQVLAKLREDLGIAEGKNTSEDGLFTIDQVACIGACNIAPVVIVDTKIYKNINKEKIEKIIDTIREKELA